MLKDEYGATQWKDMDDLFKNQSKLKLYDELGILVAQKEFIEEYRNVIAEKDSLKSKVDEYNLPILIVEGKTDKWILERAWAMLNPTETISFDIYPSGLYIDVEESEGNANQVRRAIELISPMIDEQKSIIGLFDNDREGNEQFKGLSAKIFERHNLSSISRKHKTKSIFGLLLPVPSHRENFVGNKLLQRFLEIEHYFDDVALNQYGIKGDKVAPDSSVFNIKGSNKTTFANTNINDLAEDKFIHFKLLFEKISELIAGA